MLPAFLRCHGWGPARPSVAPRTAPSKAPRRARRGTSSAAAAHPPAGPVGGARDTGPAAALRISARAARPGQAKPARALLALVGPEGFDDQRPSRLSGGMGRRAPLCRALVRRPQVLILDEPFGALDAFTREDLCRLMHRLRAERRFTRLCVTHDGRESIYLSDQVVVLSGRPARSLHVLDIDLPGIRLIGMLIAPRLSPGLRNCAPGSRSRRATNLRLRIVPRPSSARTAPQRASTCARCPGKGRHSPSTILPFLAGWNTLVWYQRCPPSTWPRPRRCGGACGGSGRCSWAAAGKACGARWRGWV